jgi:hypothetical protein
MTTVDTWDPSQNNTDDGGTIDRDVLLRLAKTSSHNQLDKLCQALSSDEIDNYRHLMSHHKEDWLKVSEDLEQHTLVHLIRFFTLAEMQLSGWEAGSKSPVIWLCRELKKRGAFPDPELIQWIKANTDNKFLPYGNLLDL